MAAKYLQLNNLDILERDTEQLVMEWHKEDNKKLFDESVSNAVSNASGSKDSKADS